MSDTSSKPQSLRDLANSIIQATQAKANSLVRFDEAQHNHDRALKGEILDPNDRGVIAEFDTNSREGRSLISLFEGALMRERNHYIYAPLPSTETDMALTA